MSGKGFPAGHVSLIVLTLLVGLLSGCQGIRSRFAQGRPAAPQGNDWARPTSGLSQAERAALDRVEDYLERTKEYASNDGDVSRPAPPAGQSAAMLTADSVPAAAPPRPQSRKEPPATNPPVTAGSRTLATGDGAVANMQVTLEDTPPARPPPALPVVLSLSIRSGQDAGLPAQDTPRTLATNEPLNVHPPDAVLSLDNIIQRLESEGDREREFDSEWRLRLLQLALNRDAQAARISPGMPPDAGRILSAVVQAVTAARAASRNPLFATEEAVERAEDLREVLAEQIDPVVSGVSLCRRVVTFGVYDEMVAEDFVSGRTVQTIVYCEIRNFHSEKTDEGKYRTELGTRLEVLAAADGRSMWVHQEDEIVDLCRQKRTDFFLAQRVTLPPTLPAGDYVLKVLVEDKLTGRAANEGIHKFTISSQTSLAAGR